MAVVVFYRDAGYKSKVALKTFGTTADLDGGCPTPGIFNSLAFNYPGLPETLSGSRLTSAFSSASLRAVPWSVAASASATPIAPSACMTFPVYTAPARSSLSGSCPTNTASSGITLSTASSATSSLSNVIVATLRISGPVAGIIVVLGWAN